MGLVLFLAVEIRFGLFLLTVEIRFGLFCLRWKFGLVFLSYDSPHPEIGFGVFTYGSHAT